MFEYNKVNVKLSDSQLNKLKSAVRNRQGFTLGMNTKMFDDSNLIHELLSTTGQTTKLRNAFEYNLSTDIKLSKAEILKIIQSGGFLGSLLSKVTGRLLKVASLAITADASAIDTGNRKEIHGSGTTTLINSNEEINGILRILQALEDSNILLKGFSRIVDNETIEQREGFLGMLFVTLRANLLGNMLTGKGVLTAGYGNQKGKAMLRAGYGDRMGF